MFVKYDTEHIGQIIKEYISQELAYNRPDLVLTDEFKLIEQSIIDSMGIFRLTTFMEEEFDIVLEPKDLLLENFESLQAIKSLLLSKLAPAEA